MLRDVVCADIPCPRAGHQPHGAAFLLPPSSLQPPTGFLHLPTHKELPANTHVKAHMPQIPTYLNRMSMISKPTLTQGLGWRVSCTPFPRLSTGGDQTWHVAAALSTGISTCNRATLTATAPPSAIRMKVQRKKAAQKSIEQESFLLQGQAQPCWWGGILPRLCYWIKQSPGSPQPCAEIRDV